MPTTRIVAAVAAIASLGLVASACGSEEKDSNGAAASPSKAPATAEPARKKKKRKGPLVKVMKSDYGRVLFDGKGRALYLFTRDKGKRSRCDGACAKAWPPFLARAKPRARKPADRELLGTVKRKNGKKQVTYNGHPLYYYVGDDEPGEILCQDVEEYGGRWYVVTAGGEAVR
jgi:predicted lipoprotein with Yx(FWY)xxD motif